MSCQDFILKLILDKIIIVDACIGLVYNKMRLVGTISSRGYYVASIRAYGIRKQVKLHQVVWVSEHGRIPANKMIDHIDRDKRNNQIANLRLASPKENANNRRSYAGKNNPSAKLNTEIVKNIRKLSVQGESYSSLSKKFSVSKSLIASIIRKEIWI